MARTYQKTLPLMGGEGMRRIKGFCVHDSVQPLQCPQIPHISLVTSFQLVTKRASHSVHYYSVVSKASPFLCQFIQLPLPVVLCPATSFNLKSMFGNSLSTEDYLERWEAENGLGKIPLNSVHSIGEQVLLYTINHTFPFLLPEKGCVCVHVYEVMEQGYVTLIQKYSALMQPK